MMGKMRDMTKWILYILILAFLGLMVVEWGADYSGLSRQSESIVGEVNGYEIKLHEFNQALRQARFEQEQRTGSTLSEDEINTLRNQVWDMLVQRILLKEEIEKLNIHTTEEDVADYVLNMLMQQYKDDPNFQTNGRFDQAKLREVLLHPDNRQILLSLEAQAQENVPYAKLVNLINQSVIVTEQEVRNEFMKENVKAKIEYLSVPVSAFRARPIEVSDTEARQFYNENKADFKVPETRQLNYVEFSTIPTPEDSAKIYQRAEEIKKQALEGKDFTELARAESEDPSVRQNDGDLGFFGRKDMVPEFTEAAFNAKPGDIVGPVKTQFGLHIIKVMDKKVEDGAEKVHAAHILLKFEPGYTTVDNAQANANLFLENAREEGFAVAADLVGAEIKQTTEFQENQFGQIPGVGRIENALTWAFRSKKNSISEVFYTKEGYYIFQVAEINPAGYRPFEEVKEICKSRVQNQKRKEFAREYAEKITPLVQQNGNFREIAQNDTANILTADTTDYFPKNIFIPKVGRAASIVARAFTLPFNELAGPLETDRGYYFIRVLDRTEFDESAYAAQRESIRNRLLQQKARNVFTEWYNELKEEADITDNRYRFFRS